MPDLVCYQQRQNTGHMSTYGTCGPKLYGSRCECLCSFFSLAFAVCWISERVLFSVDELFPEMSTISVERNQFETIHE